MVISFFHYSILLIFELSTEFRAEKSLIFDTLQKQNRKKIYQFSKLFVRVVYSWLAKPKWLNSRILMFNENHRVFVWFRSQFCWCCCSAPKEKYYVNSANRESDGMISNTSAAHTTIQRLWLCWILNAVLAHSFRRGSLAIHFKRLIVSTASYLSVQKLVELCGYFVW